MAKPPSNRKLVTYLLYAVMIVGTIVSLWGTGELTEIGVNEQYTQSTKSIDDVEMKNLETCEVPEYQPEKVRSAQKKRTSMSETKFAVSRGETVVERLGAVGAPDATTMAREMFPEMEQPRRRRSVIIDEQIYDLRKPPEPATMGMVVPADLTVSRSRHTEE